MGAISATPTGEVLERARAEAERLFGARASLADEPAAEPTSNGHRLEVPLRARDRELGVLRLERERPFQRVDVARATVLADFAVRASENARLLAEQARLSEQLITAEQDERRRLASALARHRETIRSLRDLSFSLEPVVLRDHGFGPALRALAESVALSNKIQIDVDVDAAEALSEKAQAGVYQIIREALNQAVRRGPPKRMSIRVERTADGGFDTAVSDDAPGERRRRSFDAIDEREGELPALGSEVEADGQTMRVTKVGVSPLPGGDRPCAYLQGA